MSSSDGPVNVPIIPSLDLSFLPRVTNLPFCAIITRGDAYMIENTERLPDAVSLILEWYSASRRLLPWRQDPTPYHTWIAEIMLQQTRIEAVIPYYERFLERLPDIKSLSEAEEDTYLKLWEGLGYYSRVRNLHRAAVRVMEDWGGRLPERASDLKKLPGIGDYTAAAIASIAFGERVCALDGNLLRVYARMTAEKRSIKDPAVISAASSYYTERMPLERPGDFNQALMDLGAMVCLPAAMPKCGICPFQEMCRAHGDHEETLYPNIPAKKPRAVTEMTVFVIRKGQDLVIRKRPREGLLAGLYELPNTEGHLTAEEAVGYWKEKGLLPLRIRDLGKARHIFTHREWHMTGYEILTDLEQEIPGKDLLAVSPSRIDETYSIPSAFSAYMAFVREES